MFFDTHNHSQFSFDGEGTTVEKSALAAVSAMGYGQEHIRLPLTPMEDAHRAALYAEMKKLGVL